MCIRDRANTVLDQMQKAQEAGEQLDEAELQCGMEARFFRGWCYFNLVRAFGEVPLVDFAITNSDEANIPKSSVDKIYELIPAAGSRNISGGSLTAPHVRCMPRLTASAVCGRRCIRLPRM